MLKLTPSDLHSDAQAPVADFDAAPSFAAEELDRWFVTEVRPLQGPLRRYLARRFHLGSDVEDVIQETYLRLCKLRRRRELENVRGLLFTIARHVAVDALRRQRRAPFVDVTREQACAVAGEHDVAEATARQQERQLLDVACASLPPRCREALQMRHLHGLSGREVAAQMGISGRTLENHISRAMKGCVAFLRERGVLRECSADAETTR